MTEQGKKNIVWAVFAAFMVFGIGGMVATWEPWSREKEERLFKAQLQKQFSDCMDEAVSYASSDVLKAARIKTRCDEMKKLADAAK